MFGAARSATVAFDRRGLLVTLAVSLTVLVAGGCAVKHPVANVVHGKQLFLSKCGSCHTLSHASTTGTIGPNLDDAFAQDRRDGIKTTSIEGLVAYWIRYPNSQGAMPADLYAGQDAQDVAAYVGRVASVPGQDTGALATAVQATVAPTPANGKTIFTGVGACGSCHILADAGSTGTIGPNLTTRLKADCQSPQSQKIRGTTLQKCINTAIVNPHAYLPPGYGPLMPDTFAKTLSPSQIQALVAYLASLTK
jgi:mono/diheme cytochrome c family protein